MSAVERHADVAIVPAGLGEVSPTDAVRAVSSPELGELYSVRKPTVLWLKSASRTTPGAPPWPPCSSRLWRRYRISWITLTCVPSRIYVHTDESLNTSLSYTAALLDDLLTAA
ncbi:hypothetical protein ACIA5G_39290 [Amycolatopsis sp. NPDC051758]|uniref:hypothetical protein n=1 Tax=Amycolatopsis sp. NPDC051758 TaxID=3363935 RepID=UPI0037B08CD2